MSVALLSWLLLAWWALGLALHAVSAAAAILHPRVRRVTAGPITEPLSVLFGVRGSSEVSEDHQELHLSSLLKLRHPDYELVVAAASNAADPPMPIATFSQATRTRATSVRLVAADPELHPNPRTAAFLAACAVATHDLVFVCVGEVSRPSEALASALRKFEPGVGVVSIVSVGARPRGLAAELECAFLNGYGARWLMAADLAGRNLVLGEAMLVRRCYLAAAGGLASITRDMAQDLAIGRAMQTMGLRAICAPLTVDRPLGERRLGQVLRRQLRGLARRRQHTPTAFAGEVAAGLVATSAAGTLGWIGAGMSAPWVLPLLTVATWLMIEGVLVRSRGWHLTWRSPLVWLARELLLPALWLRALTQPRREDRPRPPRPRGRSRGSPSVAGEGRPGPRRSGRKGRSQDPFSDPLGSPEDPPEPSRARPGPSRVP